MTTEGSYTLNDKKYKLNKTLQCPELEYWKACENTRKHGVFTPHIDDLVDNALLHCL